MTVNDSIWKQTMSGQPRVGRTGRAAAYDVDA